MSEFITIEIAGVGGGVTPVAIRKNHIILVRLTDNIVGLLLENCQTPIAFTLGTKDAANSLYDQIVKELK